eukprot:6839719-Heterocapsa_arctica.AAC.1
MGRGPGLLVVGTTYRWRSGRSAAEPGTGASVPPGLRVLEDVAGGVSCCAERERSGAAWRRGWPEAGPGPSLAEEGPCCP